MTEMKLQLSPDGFRSLFRLGLTKREIEVVEALLQNSTHKQSGENLFISHKTVKFHLTSIYRKLEVNSKSQLILKLYQFIERKAEPKPDQELQLPGRKI
jgi:DNA-binding CsgD family transcriptional regulator